MIGAGIFALTGQIAEFAGPWFPPSFIAGAIVTAFSLHLHQDVERLSLLGWNRECMGISSISSPTHEAKNN